MATFQKLVELHEKNKKVKLKKFEGLIERANRKKFEAEVLQKLNKEIEAAGENFCFPFEFEIEIPDELMKVKLTVLLNSLLDPIENSLMIETSDYEGNVDLSIVSSDGNTINMKVMLNVVSQI